MIQSVIPKIEIHDALLSGLPTIVQLSTSVVLPAFTKRHFDIIIGLTNLTLTGLKFRSVRKYLL
jgi:hypothetical protein